MQNRRRPNGKRQIYCYVTDEELAVFRAVKERGGLRSDAATVRYLLEEWQVLNRPIMRRFIETERIKRGLTARVSDLSILYAVVCDLLKERKRQRGEQVRESRYY